MAVLRPSKRRTVINMRSAKRQTVINMRQQTGMSTRTPEVVGSKPRGPLNPPLATREPTVVLLLAAMEGNKATVGHRPLAEAVGNPGRRALVVRGAAVADQEFAGDADGVDSVNGAVES